MITFRILTTLLVSNKLIVKGKQFINDRRIGSLLQALNVFQKREIDEMIIVDVDASKENKLIDGEFIESQIDKAHCFMPIGMGGGVKSSEDASKLLYYGADKVVLSTGATSESIKEISDKIGCQSTVVSIDYFGDTVYSHGATEVKYNNVCDYAFYVAGCGAGEIILNNIENEGTMSGLDFSKKRVFNLHIPVVMSGGANKPDDFVKAYEYGASGVSAGALYQFTQYTPLDVKYKLRDNGIPVRITDGLQ